jgi:hypothetical protein
MSDSERWFDELIALVRGAQSPMRAGAPQLWNAACEEIERRLVEAKGSLIVKRIR